MISSVRTSALALLVGVAISGCLSNSTDGPVGATDGSSGEVSARSESLVGEVAAGASNASSDLSGAVADAGEASDEAAAAVDEPGDASAADTDPPGAVQDQAGEASAGQSSRAMESGAVGGSASGDQAGDDRSLSFFVTSFSAMQELSGSSDGFGGDLGGLEGADAICQTIAEGVGAGDKTWRAFLSATSGADGAPVNAIDRIGDGPWYDANGRLVASSIEGLLGARPDGDPQTINDLPDEYGVPLSRYGDSHDILTGSDAQGQLFSTNPASTCNDWTSSDGSLGSEGAAASSGGPGGRGRRPGMAPGGHGESETSVMAGHSWPRGGGGRGGISGGDSWMSSHSVPGCAAGAVLTQMGGGFGDCVGCAGGYGAIYCFAATP